MEIFYLLVVGVINFATGHSIDWKQEQSLRVGKLKHSWTVLILNGVTFTALVSMAGFWVLTAWAMILSVGFLLPLAQIPYNGRYNFSFANGWRRFRVIRHYTYAAALVAYWFF